MQHLVIELVLQFVEGDKVFDLVLHPGVAAACRDRHFIAQAIEDAEGRSAGR